MKINVLFFGATADAVGSREIEMEIATSSTIGDLVGSVQQAHPLLAGAHLLLAVNEEYVEPGRKLNEGDNVALFTPVSGG